MSTGHSQHGVCVMQVWLTTTCPKTLIMTLQDVAESGNRAWSVCTRCRVLYMAKSCKHTCEVSGFTCREVWIDAPPFMGDDPLDSLRALQSRKPCSSVFFFLIKLGYWVLVKRASLTHFRENLLLTPTRSEKKISTPGSLHCRAQRRSKGPCWIRVLGFKHRHTNWNQFWEPLFAQPYV